MPDKLPMYITEVIRGTMGRRIIGFQYKAIAGSVMFDADGRFEDATLRSIYPGSRSRVVRHRMELPPPIMQQAVRTIRSELSRTIRIFRAEYHSAQTIDAEFHTFWLAAQEHGANTALILRFYHLNPEAQNAVKEDRLLSPDDIHYRAVEHADYVAVALRRSMITVKNRFVIMPYIPSLDKGAPP